MYARVTQLEIDSLRVSVADALVDGSALVSV
jgi:hypothetical protein